MLQADPVPSRSDLTKRIRAREKCQQCRWDKQKCLPFERDWKNGEQRCQRCEKMGHSCGPPLLSTKKHHTGFVSLEPGTVLQEIRCAPSMQSGARKLQAATKRMKDMEYNHRARPLCLKNLNHYATQLNGLSSDIDAVTTEKIKTRLANTLATMLLMLRCQLDFIKLTETLEASDRCDREQQFEAVHQLLRDEFSQAVRLAFFRLQQLGAADRRQEEYELNLWQNKERVIQCQRSLIQKSPFRQPGEETDVFSPISDIIVCEYEVLLCTKYVLVDSSCLVQSSPAQDDTDASQMRLEKYMTASEQISEFVQEVLPTNMQGCKTLSSCSSNIATSQSTWNPSHGFPPFHIAYWNHDRVMAKELWETTLRRTMRADLYGRSFAHVVVQARDLQMLTTIGKYDNSAIESAGSDDFGWTLLHMAIVLNEQDLFAVCAARGAELGDHRYLLDLAVKVGGLAITKIMLRSQLILPPFSREIKMAIEHGHAEVAQCLLPHTTDKWQSKQEVLQLADLAEQHKYFDLKNTLLDCLSTMEDATEGTLAVSTGLDKDMLQPVSPDDHKFVEMTDVYLTCEPPYDDLARSMLYSPNDPLFDYHNPPTRPAFEPSVGWPG